MTKQKDRATKTPLREPTKFIMVRQRQGDDHLARLKRASRSVGRDISDLVREAVERHLAELGA